MEASIAKPTNYLNATHGAASWFLTRDHKRIALLYLFGVSAFFLMGGIFATLIRLELLTPAGDFVSSETYNKFFTMHGVMMVFFFLIPSIPATLGNFLVPMMIGAKDLAFPRINLLSWYIYIAGGLFAVGAMVSGGVDTGWTFYTPYSTAVSNTHVVMTGLGIFIAGFSSILTGFNFIVTIHTMRAPGMTWMRLPLFIWAHYAASLIMIMGTPVVAVTLLMVVLERALNFGLFDPSRGGDPVLYQHLFWFYSHPAVYIMVLPGMGVVSELIAGFSRKPVFGYSFVAVSSLGIAFVGFLVWGHHMFTSSQSIFAGLIFSFLSYLVAIPSAIKVFNWTATLYKGSISWESPMLYAMGFIGLFTIGGLTGLFLAAIGLDLHLHDGYFVVAHFHYVMVGGTLLAYLGGLHYWWPKMTGKLYYEPLREDLRGHRLRRLQPDVLPAVHPGLHGDAAALPPVPGDRRVAGAERAVHGRRVDSRGRRHPAGALSHLLVVQGAGRRAESLGREGPRVGDGVAAADGELRGDADRDPAGLRLHQRGRACLRSTPPWPRTATSITRGCSITSTRWSSSSTRRRSACGCSWSPKCCSSAACSWPTSSTGSGIRRCSSRPATI